MKTVFIYALCEPGTRTVRYIGKTESMPERLKQHLKNSIKKNSHLGNWLRSLSGAVPNMVKLSEVSEEGGSAEEIRFIAAARISLGMNLVNGTDGGEGGETYPGGPQEDERLCKKALVSPGIPGQVFRH